MPRPKLHVSRREFCSMVIVLLTVGLTWGQATRKAADPHKFDKEIAAFDALDASTPPPARVTVFTGSSTFTKWKDLPLVFAEFHAINRAFGGSQLTDLLFFLDQTGRKRRQGVRQDPRRTA